MEKLKEFYEAAEVEVVLFEFSDIVEKYPIGETWIFIQKLNSYFFGSC